MKFENIQIFNFIKLFSFRIRYINVGIKFVIVKSLPE